MRCDFQAHGLSTIQFQCDHYAITRFFLLQHAFIFYPLFFFLTFVVQSQLYVRSFVRSFVCSLYITCRLISFIVARKQYCLMIADTRSMETFATEHNSLKKQLVTTTCVQVHIFFLYLHCSSSAPLLSWLLTTLPPLLFSLYSSSSSLLFACRSLGSVAFRFPLHRHTTVADVGKWNLSAVFMCVSNCVSVIRRKEILWKNIRTNSGHIHWTMSSFLLVLWELFVHLVYYYLLHFLRHMNISPAHCLSCSLLHLLCRSIDVYRLHERGKGTLAHAHLGFRASFQQFYTVQMMASTTIKLMTLRSMTKSCC